MVPPRRRHSFVSSETDDSLTREQLFQQLLLAREDIQVSDRALAWCQLKQTELKNSIEKTITSSAESLALHVTLLEQHVDLHVRHHEWESSVVRVQTQLSDCKARVKQTESLLEEACAKHAKLTDQF
jgi:hypothetical protein